MVEASNCHICGVYEQRPVENDYHYVTITQEGGEFKWSNRAGISWKLSPDTFYEDKKLRSGEDCVYPGEDVTVELDSDGHHVTRLVFLGEYYWAAKMGHPEHKGKSLSNSEMNKLCGKYEHVERSNEWHDVTISIVDNALQWENAAGVKWTHSTEDFEREFLLRTNEDCPYFP